MAIYSPQSGKGRRMLLFFCAILLFVGCHFPKPSTVSTGNDVLFIILAPSARTVSVAGDFNRWNTDLDRLVGPDEEGFWKTAMRLPAGRYEYLFVINGTDWVQDPAAFAADDGLGGANSVIIVGAPPS